MKESRIVAPNIFAAAGIDRAVERRRDGEWLATRLRDPGSRVVPVWRSRSLVSGALQPRAALIPADEAAPLLERGEAPILLGHEGETTYFALEVDGDDPTGEPVLAGRGEFQDLHRIGALLERREAGLLAFARAMTFWHRRHRFCGACGGPTASADGGHLRVCGAGGCGAHHFPRTDPAVIVLVTSGDRCLLGRQASWAPGMYATIAGFVEPGESLEDAVAREVLEETGIRVADVRYHSSQPWPFPASLMLGFAARAETEAIRLDPEELEDARWFTRDELRDLPRKGALRLPPEVSIAYALVRDWLDRESTACRAAPNP